MVWRRIEPLIQVRQSHYIYINQNYFIFYFSINNVKSCLEHFWSFFDQLQCAESINQKAVPPFSVLELGQVLQPGYSSLGPLSSKEVFVGLQQGLEP